MAIKGKSTKAGKPVVARKKTVKNTKSTRKAKTKAGSTPEADTVNVSAPAFAFGSPDRIRQLVQLIQHLMVEAINANNVMLVGSFAEIKHALHELAKMKEQLAAQR